MPQKIPAWIEGSCAADVAATSVPIARAFKFALLGNPLPASLTSSLPQVQMAAKIATAVAYAAYALYHDMQDTVFIGDDATELQKLAQWLILAPQSVNTEVFSDALVRLAHDIASWFEKNGLPDVDADIVINMLCDLGRDIAMAHWKRPFSQFNMVTHSVLTVFQIQQLHNLKNLCHDLRTTIRYQLQGANCG